VDSFRDDPEYNVMKYLVFGIISVVYFQSYKLLFLKPIAFLFIWSSHFTVLRIVAPGKTKSQFRFVQLYIAYPSLGKTSEAVPGVVPYFCATSLNSPLSWPPPSLVPLLSAGVPCYAIVDTAPLIARPGPPPLFPLSGPVFSIQ
jgi:hypothetical protein